MLNYAEIVKSLTTVQYGNQFTFVKLHACEELAKKQFEAAVYPVVLAAAEKFQNVPVRYKKVLDFINSRISGTGWTVYAQEYELKAYFQGAPHIDTYIHGATDHRNGDLFFKSVEAIKANPPEALPDITENELDEMIREEIAKNAAFVAAAEKLYKDYTAYRCTPIGRAAAKYTESEIRWCRL